MQYFHIYLSLIVAFFGAVFGFDEDPRCKEPSTMCIHSTKVFIMPLKPTMFNWTYSASAHFSYRPALLGSPDLPSWINYVYSKTHHSGYLYGAPPLHETNVTLEIIGLNHETYDTSGRVINLIIIPKREPAKYQVQLKVNNLAVEDMFDATRLDILLSVFREELWPEAAHDLHVTFLASAVQLGARLPLRPDEKEGVVIYLGSASNVSQTLLQLQEEVRPLYRLRKVGSCPRDFKRTTVDRLFRQQNIEVDWCGFQLTGEGLQNDDEGPAHLSQHHSHYHHKPLLTEDHSVWYQASREEVPLRSYVHEFLLSILVPMLVMILLAVLLSIILCFHHEGMDDGSDEYFDSIFDLCEDVWGNRRNQQTPAVQMVRYAAVQRATSTLRSLSVQRDTIPSTPRLTTEKNNALRPQPPPYGASIRSSGGEF